MDHLEFAIVDFLRSNPETWFSRKEIARKAIGRDGFEENQHWIDVPLAALVGKKAVEQNDFGLYRLGKDKDLS